MDPVCSTLGVQKRALECVRSPPPLIPRSVRAHSPLARARTEVRGSWEQVLLTAFDPSRLFFRASLVYIVEICPQIITNKPGLHSEACPQNKSKGL